MLVEVAAVNAPLVKLIVILVAKGCARFVKAATPPTAVMLVVPIKVPAPALRVAVTTSVSLLRTLLYVSSMKITGCCAKATPATAVAEGCVAMTSLLAAAGLTVLAVPVLEPIRAWVTSKPLPSECPRTCWSGSGSRCRCSERY